MTRILRTLHACTAGMLPTVTACASRLGPALFPLALALLLWAAAGRGA